MDFVGIFRGLIGIVLLVGIAFFLSNNKKRVNWRLVISGLAIQFTIAIFIMKGEAMGAFFAPLGWPKELFRFISKFFVLVLNFTGEGSQFVFGPLGVGPGNEGSMGMFFAFQVLPVIIFFASLMSVLYYLGVMQKVVQAMAWVFTKTYGNLRR